MVPVGVADGEGLFDEVLGVSSGTNWNSAGRYLNDILNEHD